MAARFSAMSATYQNILPVDNDITIRRDRERRGLCGGCGTKILHVRRTAGFVMKEYVPLTIEGVVRYGRCLYCYPDDHPDIAAATRRKSDPVVEAEIPVAIVAASAEVVAADLVNDENDFPEPSAPPMERCDVVTVADATTSRRPSSREDVGRRRRRRRRSRETKEAHVENVLRTMRSSPRCPNAQATSYDRLNKAVLANSDYRSIVGTAPDGIATLVSNMVSHAGNAVVTRHACASIMILSHKSDHNRNAVSEHGGVRTVVDAIEEHPRDVDLLCAACGALWSLSYEHGENQRTIGETNAIRLILSSMKSHMDVAKLQEWACGLLNAVSSDERNRRRLLDSGGVDVMIAVLRTHPTNVKIVRPSTNLLRNLMRDDADLLTKEKRNELEDVLKTLPNERVAADETPHAIRDIL